MYQICYNARMKRKLEITLLITFVSLYLVGCSALQVWSENLVGDEMAGNADVTYVRAVQTAPETWTFHVTVEHPDKGWEDYADGWDVVLPDGTVVKPDAESSFTRLLLHPHVNEQPFTRSQSNIVIPEGVTEVSVRAHDMVDGFGGNIIEVDLTIDNGDGYEVLR